MRKATTPKGVPSKLLLMEASDRNGFGPERERERDRVSECGSDDNCTRLDGRGALHYTTRNRERH